MVFEVLEIVILDRVFVVAFSLGVFAVDIGRVSRGRGVE